MELFIKTFLVFYLNCITNFIYLNIFSGVYFIIWTVLIITYYKKYHGISYEYYIVI